MGVDGKDANSPWHIPPSQEAMNFFIRCKLSVAIFDIGPATIHRGKLFLQVFLFILMQFPHAAVSFDIYIGKRPIAQGFLKRSLSYLVAYGQYIQDRNDDGNDREQGCHVKADWSLMRSSLILMIGNDKDISLIHYTNAFRKTLLSTSSTASVQTLGMLLSAADMIVIPPTMAQMVSRSPRIETAFQSASSK